MAEINLRGAKATSTKLVLIEWEDSLGCSSKWQPLDGIEQPKPLLCKSVGWLVYDGKDCKVVVPHLTGEHATTPVHGCGDMAIPTKCITKVTVLKES